MRTFILFICLAALLTSCVKDIPDQPVPVDTLTGPVVITVPISPVDSFWVISTDVPTGVPSEPMLKRETVQGGKIAAEYFYNSKWLLTRYINHDLNRNVISAETVNRYNYAGLLERVDKRINYSSSSIPMYDTSFALLYYDANKRLKETVNYRIKNKVVIFASRAIPQYDAQGRTISVGIYDSTATQLYNKNTYEYNSQGNIIKSMFFQTSYLSGASPSVTYIYEFDQKKNPRMNQWILPYGSNVNNVIKHVSTWHISGSPPATAITTFKTYNAQGYPTLVNEDNGLDYVYEYYQ